MSRSNHDAHDENQDSLHAHQDPESRRLHEDARREKNWKRWGPYLSERQWGTVREDYSPDGTCWDYFPHDHARSRAYRWGEDGLLGITDRECRLCFGLALWNGRDPILKERLFGLTGPEGNHGEDVKESYFYLDSTPTHSYMKALYKYPQGEYPYRRLVEENRRRGRDQREFEIEDTGAFEGSRYFDVVAEYAKAGPDDILIRITVSNRGPEAATVHLLPTLWFRNTWTWGCTHDGCWIKPRITALDDATLAANHVSLGRFRLAISPGTNGERPDLLFTENESNTERLFGSENASPYVKDAFHRYVIEGKTDAVNPKGVGTKAAALYRVEVPAGGHTTVKLRLFSEDDAPQNPFNGGFDRIFSKRVEEADAFYAARQSTGLTVEERRVSRQAYASLLWSKQFYHYVVKDWLDGDPEMPKPPDSRRQGRNHEWTHLFNRDVISMPDKWEYPWYAAWDLAFHMIPFATIDPEFAKEQIVLFLREWYMHASGKLPAYEFALDDVNPPVLAWAAWRVYKMSAPPGKRDQLFLERVFQKLLLNFTWWVNRKDAEGKNIFGGGFLGLDNIGVFDRSRPLPTGGHLEQADGTAWMAFYCTTMLAMALELASHDPAYEDMASKFFEHFVAIADAMNGLGGTGLWDMADGFYYDQLHVDGQKCPLRVRSMVGLIPLYAVEILEDDVLKKLPGFAKRMRWFLENRKDLAKHITYLEQGHHAHRLLAIPSRERLERVLHLMLNEGEFLSPHGIRSVSRVHAAHPYTFWMGSDAFTVEYAPGESTTGLFGGNSNWRGPIWMPVNFLLIEALERYHHFYGDSFMVECPTGSGHMMNLQEVARELSRRLVSLFVPDASGARPCNGGDRRYVDDPHFRGLVPFHEYFHGDTGRGLGASHQTGWTSLVVRCIEDLAKTRTEPDSFAPQDPVPHEAAKTPKRR
ncbi:MAG: glucosidase [Planctomycetes bacterium]|nr:glucosidase [Planctomycetota bacterium]MBI3843717.1 glucosidase [Planctomycetota bacterium]